MAFVKLRVLARSFAALTLVSLLTSCATVESLLEPPKLSLTNIEILEANGFSIRLALDINVQNPNPVPLPINGLSYSLMLNGNEFLSGVASDLEGVGAFSETQVRLEAGTNLLGLMGLASEILSGQTDQYEYRLDAKIGLSGFSRSIEVSETGIVPIDLNF